MVSFIKWALFGLWSVLFAVLFGPWITAWLQQQGLFDDPNQQVADFLRRFAALKDYFDQASISPWLAALLAGTVGFYLGFLFKAVLEALSRGVEVSIDEVLRETTAQMGEVLSRRARKIIATPAVQIEREPASASVSAPREFIYVKPSDLLGMRKGLTGAQAERLVAPYKGKWMTITTKVLDVSAELRLGFVLLQGQDPDGSRVLFNFPSAAHDRLQLMPSGHEVTISGKLDKVDTWMISLGDCELVSDRQGAHPPS